MPAALKRALWARDGGCSFPGCTHTRFVNAHHIRHWANGGETSLENTTLLCGRHHRLVHEGGYGIRKDHQGQRYFMRPDGRAIPRYGYRPDDMVDEQPGDERPGDERIGAMRGVPAEAPYCWGVFSDSAGVREAAALYAVAR